MTQEHILVIKHGALGDVVLATGLFAAIRAHHPDAKITLLSTALYAKLLNDSPFFDDIWIDDKPKLWQFVRLGKLKKRLRSAAFAWVYDLQTSTRSSSYFHLLSDPKPNWSGVVAGCSHPHDNPNRASMHTLARQSEQLHMAGIASVPDMPQLDWLQSDVSEHKRVIGDAPYGLLVAGGAAHRPEKRWPATHYAALARRLKAQGITPVCIGAGAEDTIIAEIEAASEGAVVNLCNETSFADIVTLARGAQCAVGNDTGPMHLIAAAGCPSVTLFSGASSPERSAPCGASVQCIQRDDLAELGVDEVFTFVGSFS